MADQNLTAAPLRLVVEDDHAALAIDGIEVVGLTVWRDRLFRRDDGGGGSAVALTGPEVVAVILSHSAADTLEGNEVLSDLLSAAEVPVVRVSGAADAREILGAALSALASRTIAVRRAAAADQRALAQMRSKFMQVQDDHAELETWVWDQLAPKEMIVRNWYPTADFHALVPGEPPVVQPIPAPVRGFVALDLHIAESAPAGTLTVAARRPLGPAFEGMVTSKAVSAGIHGWIQLQFPRAGAGAPEDVSVEVSFTADMPQAEPLKLSLAPESPFPDSCLLVDGAPLSNPLALRVKRGLPRLPSLPLYDTRTGLPADGVTRLVRPNTLQAVRPLRYFKTKVPRAFRTYPDAPRVEPRHQKNAALVQPSVHRPVGGLIRGLRATDLRQVRATIQICRHDTLGIAFAVGAAPTRTLQSVEEALAHVGDWVHLLPAEWGEVWYDLPEPLSGEIDLLCLTAMPNMPFNRNAEALFHGFRLTAGQAVEVIAGTPDEPQE